MIWNNANFFTDKNGLYSILIGISILIILLILRILLMAKN